MARFTLREFSRPDYASRLPKHDPNNAIWPRISMVMKMLNEIPWFKKDEEELLREKMLKERRLGKVKRELEAQFADEDAVEKELDEEATRPEIMAGSPEEAEYLMEGYKPEEVDRPTYELPDDISAFDPNGKSKGELKAMQTKLRDGGYDIAVDGIWGPKSQTAFEDYVRKSLGYGQFAKDMTYAEQTGLSDTIPGGDPKSEMDRELDAAAKLNGVRGYASADGGK